MELRIALRACVPATDPDAMDKIERRNRKLIMAKRGDELETTVHGD